MDTIKCPKCKTMRNPYEIAEGHGPCIWCRYLTSLEETDVSKGRILFPPDPPPNHIDKVSTVEKVILWGIVAFFVLMVVVALVRFIMVVGPIVS